MLIQLLSSFSCEQDRDIERFLRSRAVEFERLSKSRTYLICDEEQLADTEDKKDALIIYGYISLALKILSVPDTVSNRVRKELDGFHAKLHGQQIQEFPCYLIGQLSRSSNVPKDAVSGKQLIGFACDVAAAAVDAVGGRYIMAECRNEEKLIRFYERNHFREIARVSDKDQTMVQLIRRL